MRQARGAQKRDVGGAQLLARVAQRTFGHRVGSGVEHAIADGDTRLRFRPSGADACVGGPDSIDRQDGVGSGRHRFAGFEPSRRWCDDHRRVRRCVRDLLGAYGPPIAQQCGHGRYRRRNARILGEHAAFRLGEGELARRNRLHDRSA